MSDWRDQARCRTYDPELFFPDGHSLRYDAQVAAAKAVCARCPVRAECLDWALATGQQHGIWGELTEGERRRLRPAGRRAS